MLSLYPTKYMTTNKLYSDMAKIDDYVQSVVNYLDCKDLLSLPTIALGMMNRIPANGFYPEEAVWFLACHAEWLAKRKKFLSLELYKRDGNTMVLIDDDCGKFSPDILLYGRDNLITLKQQCQSWLIDRGRTCNIRSASHLEDIFREMSQYDFWRTA